MQEMILISDEILIYPLIVSSGELKTVLPIAILLSNEVPDYRVRFLPDLHLLYIRGMKASCFR